LHQIFLILSLSIKTNWLHQIAHAGVSLRISLQLFGLEIIFEEFQPMWSRYLNVTDGRTDRQTDRRYTVASPRSA